MQRSGTILVPYDFTRLSEHALVFAAEEARLRATSLTLLHVYVTAPPALPTDAVMPIWNEPRPELLDDLQQRLRQVVAQHGFTDATAETRVGSDAGRVIIQRAEELHPAMVVLGTHGRRGLSRAVLGSTAEYVMRHANWPVVTVRPPHGASGEHEREHR